MLILLRCSHYLTLNIRTVSTFSLNNNGTIGLLRRNHFCTGKKTFYHVLGLTPEATPQEIKTAYYTLSKQYHPDVIPKGQNFEEAAIKFLEVGEAYEILGNKEKRSEYDRQLLLTKPGLSSPRPHRTDEDIARDLRNYQDFRSQWRRKSAASFTQQDYLSKFDKSKRYKFDQKDFDKFYELYKKRQHEDQDTTWESKARAEAHRISNSQEMHNRRKHLYEQYHGVQYNPETKKTNAPFVLVTGCLIFSSFIIILFWMESR